MNKKEIQQLLKTSDYDFLRKNKQLGDNIILLVMGGSHAYGLDTPTSDVDIRGVFMNDPREILGLESTDRIEDSATDTVLYSLPRFLELCCDCNPNIIEIIGVEEDSILYASPSWPKAFRT